MATDSTDSTAAKTPKVETPKEVAEDNSSMVKATNQSVEKAGEEAATRLKGRSRESFNVTDAILGADEQHGINVKKAQAATFGEEYDPKSDPEVTPPAISPTPSGNQNNLKHEDDKLHNDPFSSRNYLGQLI